MVPSSLTLFFGKTGVDLPGGVLNRGTAKIVAAWACGMEPCTCCSKCSSIVIQNSSILIQNSSISLHNSSF